MSGYICCIQRIYFLLISLLPYIRISFSSEGLNKRHLQEPLPSVMDFNSWNIVWSLFFGLLTTLIVVGNLLTVWIFLKQRVRKRAHVLLINLAVADLLVGLLTVPLYITINTIFYLSQPYFSVWRVSNFTDIFTGIASIVTLAAISLERMYAIGWPFRRRTLNFRVYIFAIAISWIIAALFTYLAILVDFSIITFENYLYTRTLFLSTPLLVICIAYYIVWKKQKTMMGNQNHIVREKRLAKTLFMHYYCNFSFDLAAISNIVFLGIFWCNWKSTLL